MKSFDNVLDRLIASEKRNGILTAERDEAKRALANAVLSRDDVAGRMTRAAIELERLRKVDPAANALYDAVEKFLRGPRNDAARKELDAAMKAIEPILDRIPF